MQGSRSTDCHAGSICTVHTADGAKACGGGLYAAKRYSLLLCLVMLIQAGSYAGIAASTPVWPQLDAPVLFYCSR